MGAWGGVAGGFFQATFVFAIFKQIKGQNSTVHAEALRRKTQSYSCQMWAADR